jgi:stage III sporulation protein AA
MQATVQQNGLILDQIAVFFPERIKGQLMDLPVYKKQRVEEVRLRANRPVAVRLYDELFFLKAKVHQPDKVSEQQVTVSQQEIEEMIKKMAGYSLYAFEEEFKQGYITLTGGCRVGLAGKVVIKDGQVQTIKQINGLNVRISHEIKGCANDVMSYIINGSVVRNTLILSPPQMGKTTLLRDIVRQISDGKGQWAGRKVSLVDERSEIAATMHGVLQNDVGLQTDVLDGCPKHIGMMMLLRSMSPDVIATDEIGKQCDIEAIEEAMNAGVSVVTTAHAANLTDALQRQMLKTVIERKYFERIIILGNSHGTGTVEKILDGTTLENLLKR